MGAQEKAAAKDTDKEPVGVIEAPFRPAAASTGIDKNVILVVTEAGTVFASLESSEELCTLAEGSFLVASGPPVEVDGYDMVPLQPCGSVELRIVQKMGAPESNVGGVDAQPEEVVETSKPEANVASVTPAKTANKAAKAQAEEEDLDNLLSEFGVVLQPVAPKSGKKKGK